MASFTLPDFYMPWSARSNPHAGRARSHVRAWAQDVGILGSPHSVWDEHDFDGADYASFTASVHPDATAGELDLLTDWYVWLFYLDNDIVSYDKELLVEDDRNNGVHIVHDFLGCELQEAVEIVNDLITSRLQRFERTVAVELEPLFAEQRLAARRARERRALRRRPAGLDGRRSRMAHGVGALRPRRLVAQRGAERADRAGDRRRARLAAAPAPVGALAACDAAARGPRAVHALRGAGQPAPRRSPRARPGVGARDGDARRRRVGRTALRRDRHGAARRADASRRLRRRARPDQRLEHVGLLLRRPRRRALQARPAARRARSRARQGAGRSAGGAHAAGSRPRTRSRSRRPRWSAPSPICGRGCPPISRRPPGVASPPTPRGWPVPSRTSSRGWRRATFPTPSSTSRRAAGASERRSRRTSAATSDRPVCCSPTSSCARGPFASCSARTPTGRGSTTTSSPTLASSPTTATRTPASSWSHGCWAAPCSARW